MDAILTLSADPDTSGGVPYFPTAHSGGRRVKWTRPLKQVVNLPVQKKSEMPKTSYLVRYNSRGEIKQDRLSAPTFSFFA